jgi:type II secretory pathway pseudopilin PulG
MSATLIHHRPDSAIAAFSLVEVVIALGVCVFVLVVLLGLYGTGIRVNRESESQIQAGNLVSLILSSRSASPTNQVNLTRLAIPVSAMTNAYTNAYAGNSATSYVGNDGLLTNAANASYIVTCMAGTNATSGPNIAQVYLMLSWPVQVSQANAGASDHYEVTTFIPFR